MTAAPALNRNSISRSHLNDGQQEAADDFFSFLFSKEKVFKITGGGGVGKTFLMLYLIKEVFQEYFNACTMTGLNPEFTDMDLTATTNKAAEVLAAVTGYPTSTIHSYLGLKVYDDYSTGESKIVRGHNWKPIAKKVVFIDECSFIDRHLEKELLATLVNCKIVYVGDHCQLAPIKEPISPIYNKIDPIKVLTEPMRNAEQPALQAICQQMRDTVETGVFNPITLVPGVIDLLDDIQMEQLISQHFKRMDHNDKILAYTNRKVMAFNDHIRTIRNLPDEYTIGEILVANQVCHLTNGIIPVEREVEIVALRYKDMIAFIDGAEEVHFEVIDATLKTVVGNELEGTTAVNLYNVKLPVDRPHYHALIKYFAKRAKTTKNWANYYELKNNYPDLRARDASTVHKAQGSSYDTVFIDLSDMSTCRQSDVMARMLYVAVSRARHRIYLYGNLAEKFGGLAPATAT